MIKDDNDMKLDRTSACYDEDASVVMRNVDACPGEPLFTKYNIDNNSQYQCLMMK